MTTKEPEKKSFHDFPLQKIFKINTQTFPENISVTEVGFSSRVLNLLDKNNIATLDKLLDLSLRELSNTPGFGKSSVDNVIATLKKFSESKKKKISAKTFNLAKEELDKFLRDAALRHDPQIDLIITAFENFSSNLNKELSLHKPLAQKIKDLPAEFKNKKVHLLLHVYDFKDKKPFEELPEDLTLSVFTKWLAEKSLPFDETELINFVDELNVNLKSFSRKLVDATLKKGREFEIIYRRAQKMTLEEVGSIFSITRERVRQIELSAIDKFAKLNSDARKFFYLLHAVTDGRAILTLNDVKNFIDDSDAEIIWFLAVRTNLNSEIFSFDKKRNVFVFYDGIDFDEAEFLNRLPKIMSEKFFDEITTTFAAEKNCPVELMRERLSKFYERSGKFLHCGRLTLTFKCGYILKENFPNGYKIADKFFYSRFIYYLRDIFDEKNSLTQRNLDSIIGRIGVLCNRGKYIHPDFVNIPPAIIERVKKFIDNSSHTAIFYKEIFESLRKIFAGTQITNHYFLQGVIRFYELPYILRKDYLTKVDEVNMGKEFNRFVEEHGEVSPEDIKENFVSFKLINKTLLMRRCVEIINIGGGKFLHSVRLKLTHDDFKNIKDFLNQICTTPINSQRLFDLFSNRFAEFMTRNEIFTHEKLFGIMKYMFSDEFNFSRQHVSIKDITEINSRKILLFALKDTDKIAINDFVKICQGQNINCRHKTYLIELLRPDFIRIDEFTLARPESIGVTDEVISAIVDKLSAAIERNGGWQATSVFNDYDSVPPIKVAWNGFLLDSVASLAEDMFYILKIPHISAKFSTTILVSEEFAEDDFKSFVLKILNAKHKEKPFRSKDEILIWLQEHGLCDKKIPKFLEDDNIFGL